MALFEGFLALPIEFRGKGNYKITSHEGALHYGEISTIKPGLVVTLTLGKFAYYVMGTYTYRPRVISCS